MTYKNTPESKHVDITYILLRNESRKQEWPLS